MANLYEISSELASLVNPETGEIQDFDRFEALNMQRDSKIENMALWYKNLISDAAQYKEEKDKFAALEKAAKNKADSLKRYIDTFLSGTPFKTTRIQIRYLKSSRVVVDHPEEVEKTYLRYPEPEVNREAVKAALAAGQTVSGCHIEESQNINIK